MRAWTRTGVAIREKPEALDRLLSAPALDRRHRAYLRLITPDDAAFTYSLRADASLNAYLGAPPTNTGEQRAWIEQYKKREAECEEFYFIICCDGRDVGTARIYDLRRFDQLKSFGWGSWIIRAPRPAGLAPFSAFMIYELGFEALGYDQAHFEVECDNPSLDTHLRMGALHHGVRDGGAMLSMPRAAFHTLKSEKPWLPFNYRAPLNDQPNHPEEHRSGSSTTVTDSERERYSAAVDLMFREFPALTARDLRTPLELIEIDSFALLTLRTVLERSLAVTIDDASWTRFITLADIAQFIAAKNPDAPIAVAAVMPTERRTYSLNMPQMALGGISESWLFKEIGDMHWSMIARGLRTPSSQIADIEGHRLYATFTRFQLGSTVPLATYEENETVTIDADPSRYGAGIFFSDATIEGKAKRARVHLMSSFSKYGEAGANSSLLKGQPKIPNDCGIRTLGELPPFGRQYQALREKQLPAAIFACEYEILPPHDINGVGLLYFAAYPIINDICAMRYGGRTVTLDFSTVHRDVFYFANSDPQETLVFRVHRWNADEKRLAIEASISRRSDDALMAWIVTRKARSNAR